MNVKFKGRQSTGSEQENHRREGPKWRGVEVNLKSKNLNNISNKSLINLQSKYAFFFIRVIYGSSLLITCTFRYYRLRNS